MRAAIGGIVNHDGGPVETRDLRLIAARARLPWGGSPRLVSGDGFGLVRIAALLEDLGGGAWRFAAPVRATDERYEVVVDGTVDNRLELARELGLPAEAAAPGSEPQIIAAACERWGADCPARLIGEFAFLAWDRRERQLLAARDAFGLRELFFSDHGGQLRIASQATMLLGKPSLSDIDHEYAADFLACQDASGPATPFKGIRRLQAGHGLTLVDGKLDTRRAWNPTEQELPRYRGHQEIDEHFLSLFEEAVGRCLATGGRVWAELSGGFDSSSIVCVAQKILQSEPGLARDFATLTSVWNETPRSDERQWSAAVVEQCRVVNHQVCCDDLFFDDSAEEARYRSDPHFGVLFHPMIRASAERLRACGVAVLLSGARAESVVLSDSPPPVHLADMLRSLRLTNFLRELVRWQRGTHKPLVNLVLPFVLRPLLGRRRYLRSIDDRGVLDPWVHKGFARRMKLRERAREARTEHRFHSIARQLQYEQLLRSEHMNARGFIEWSCELRHPFLYRPLVELALAIPWELKVAPREHKLLLRRALAGHLPDQVRSRRGGAGPGTAVYKAYAKRWATIEPVVRSSVLVSMGFLDGVEFSRVAELARFGGVERFASFLTCLAFEYWLRAIAGDQQGCELQVPAPTGMRQG